LNVKLTRHKLLFGAALPALALSLSPLLSLAPFTSPVQAQDLSSLAQKVGTSDSRMLLAADELIYDRDAQIITADGNVQIEYDGKRIVAQKVSYNQQTRRVVASGRVEIVDADGTRLYADEIDLTDDLGEGFVNSLRLETTDNTRFAAESVERSQGQMTVFNNGIYTACEVCYEKPARDVLWQVKARKIIWNGETKTMRFEDSHFEMFGMPLAWFPVFEMADPTVKRKSGFLFPSFTYKDKLGAGVTSAYFWNLAPNYDFTLSGTAYSKQGVLMQGEWRHRLENGDYDIRLAHINQQDPSAFDKRTIDRRERNRYALSSRGDFSINSRWKYGWDVMVQSDRNFSRTYNLPNYDSALQRSQLYLTGLDGRNYFDMRGYHFNVQEDTINANSRHDKQPWVLPRIDYSFIPDELFYGGELKFSANLQTIFRDSADFAFADWTGDPLANGRLAGIDGSSVRFGSEIEWQRRFVSDFGLVTTPIFVLRGDLFNINAKDKITYTSFSIVENAFRGMATAGLELSYPLLLASSNSSHILEPIAQIFVRNDESYAGKLINEDAQSFVFDATRLFARDKFSGFDRVEGGIRANLGMRYSGSFGDDWSIYALAGQSFHLGGRNSFATRDFVSVGADSGLETARSDYVAMVGVDDGQGLSVAARGRFDEADFAVRRGELAARKIWGPLAVGGQYAYIERQPEYGYAKNRQEVSFDGRYKLNDNWTINASSSYDLISETLVRAGGGLSYLDECFGLLLGYSQTRDSDSKASTQKWNVMLSFRTLGDIGGNLGGDN